jgi:DNA-binding NarL/FixJ family response regulator
MLVDDHPIVLAGLSALIESEDGLELVAAARTAAQARAVTTEPDVAVVDLELPDGDGIELGATLKRTWPGLRVVVLTMHADDQAVIRSLGAGLDGYLLKDSDPEDVLAAIHTAARGALVLGKWASGAVVAAAASAPRTTPSVPSMRGTWRSSNYSCKVCQHHRSPHASSSRPRQSATGSQRCSPNSGWRRATRQSPSVRREASAGPKLADHRGRTPVTRAWRDDATTGQAAPSAAAPTASATEANHLTAINPNELKLFGRGHGPKNR